MALPFWKTTAAVTCLLIASSVHAHAQVCGDADGSGAVTVSDGVQALRAAAALSSSCSPTTCDVDGSGSVTVTDGVNVLRKAAGVAIVESCGGGLDSQIETLLGNALPIFGTMTKIGSPASAGAAGRQDCENPGGFLDFNDQGDILYSNCNLGGFNFDGFFQLRTGTFSFDITFTDLTSGNADSLAGQLSFRQSGQTQVFDGFFNLTSNFGDFRVEFADLVTNTVGNFVGGALTFSVDEATLPNVDFIQLTFSPANTALVEVVRVDQSRVPFNFDLVTGELTRISN